MTIDNKFPILSSGIELKKDSIDTIKDITILELQGDFIESYDSLIYQLEGKSCIYLNSGASYPIQKKYGLTFESYFQNLLQLDKSAFGKERRDYIKKGFNIKYQR